MAIELGLRALLLSKPSITAIAQAQTIGKRQFRAVYNEFAAQGHEPPFIIITQIDHDPMKCLDGTTGMAKTEFDVDCYAKTADGAIELSAAVESVLKDYTGLAGADDRIYSVLFNSKRHDLLPLADGSDQRMHVVSTNYEIHHTPVP